MEKADIVLLILIADCIIFCLAMARTDYLFIKMKKKVKEQEKEIDAINGNLIFLQEQIDKK